MGSTLDGDRIRRMVVTDNIVTNNLTVSGTFTFGDAAVDTLILKGRVATGTAAGSNITIDSTYLASYGDLWKAKFQMSSWTGKDAFTGYSFRAENRTAGTGKGLRAMEILAADYDVGLTGASGNLQGLYVDVMLKSGATAITYTGGGAAEFCISPEGDSGGAITITNYLACARLSPSSCARTDSTNAAKIHGLYLTARDGSGGSTKLGDGICMINDSSQTGTRTLTNGLNINIGCTTGVKISTCSSYAIDIGTGSKRAILIGRPWVGTGETGMKSITDGTSWNAGAPVGFYFGDGGAALTAWGECFTVNQTILTASTGGTHTGWPYTGFFVTDVEANVTDNGSNHWPTLMTSFCIGTGVTLDGFTVGASSHHASVDVNGTLASGSKLSCISFGGNWPGTISGAFVVPLHVRPTNQNWTSFVKFESATNGCFQTEGSSTGTLTNCPHSGNPAYWLKIDIAGTNYCVPVFAVT